MRKTRSTGKRFTIAALTFGVAFAIAAPEIAQAHFVLQSPPAWRTQTSLGLPEKLGPCGDEDDGTDASAPTGTVTAVQQGQKLTVTINEVIFHPGHYRISLAEDRSLLPTEPPVDAGSTPCGTAVIDPAPTYPVLADGVFVHTTPFTTPQSIEITIPSTITCTKCTLQVIEFMSDHPLNNPGGCFYHHCADLAIQPPDSGGTDGSITPTPDSGGSGHEAGTKSGADAAAGQDSGGGGVQPGFAGGSTGTPNSSGCGCSVVGGAESGAFGVLTLGVLALFARRRKRASERD